MYLPKSFDMNEIGIVIGLVIAILICVFLPKRFPMSMIFIILMTGISVSRIADHILAGPPLVDLYDIMDRNKIEVFGMLTYIFFAPFAYLFVYVYDRYQLRGMKVLYYVLISSLLAVGVEGLLVYIHVYEYLSWKIAYSFTTYLIVQPLTLLLFEYLKSKYPPEIVKRRHKA